MGYFDAIVAAAAAQSPAITPDPSILTSPVLAVPVPIQPAQLPQDQQD